MWLKRQPAMSGAELRMIRKQMNFTQEELAIKLGVHWNTLARWERELVPISKTIARLLHSIVESREYAQKVLDR